MKKEIVEIANEKMAEPSGKLITRAQALRKVGYVAVSAATMMILLSNPSKANALAIAPAASPADPAAPTKWTP